MPKQPSDLLVGVVTRETKRVRGERASLDRFLGRCAAGLESLYTAAAEENAGGERGHIYTESLEYVAGMLAVLVAAERIASQRSSAGPMRAAAQALYDAVENPSEEQCRVYEEAVLEARDTSGLNIFAAKKGLVPDASVFNRLARVVLCPTPEAPIDRIYFETMPLSWLGLAYQHLLAHRPSETGESLEVDRSGRKVSGVYFTPPCLVTYIIESVLSPLLEPLAGTLGGRSLTQRLASVKVLDPAMGGGDFLNSALDFLSGSATFGRGDSMAELRAELAAECVFGVDVDPLAVEIARFDVWASSTYADGIAERINAHLICADALGTKAADETPFDWAGAFPEVFSTPEVCGFDAVVGNPPYVAAKNALGTASASGAGQSDFYLMFLSAAIDNQLVKPGGMLSMVLPDPMLVRENAAQVRRALITDWTVISLLHIANVFPDANVANVAPVCRNAPSTSGTFLASRIDRAADRKSFVLRPRKTALECAKTVRKDTVLAQERCEFLYLLEDGAFGDIIRRIHGDSVALSDYQPPFSPLRELNVSSIYRGEEVGKAAIGRQKGDLPILLGGQSIRPYEVVWEGRKVARSWVRKPMERYSRTKLLIQKSSARLIAALDRVSRKHGGYVFPQSVYAVELRESGMHELYLLCILNSDVMNEYVWRTVTGYKLLQPQLELEDIRGLPIRRVSFTTRPGEREADVVEGMHVFEEESLRAGDSVPFPQLDNFAARCLTANPERSDVVHDLLVHLGRLMVDLTRLSRESPSADTTRRAESTRTAIETVVWRLYSSQPAQMALPM